VDSGRDFRLLVFDWDGTLMDSEARIVSAMQTAIAEAKLPPPSNRQIRNIIGLGLDDAIRQLYPETEAHIRDHLAERYRVHFRHANSVSTPLFPGARETLHRLHVTGYLLAVATGKSRRGLNRAFEETGVGPLFHASQCADEACSKPHPQMLEAIMDKLGVDTRDTLVIGDSEYDLQMANNVGTACLAVSYGVQSPEHLLKYKPLDLLEDIVALPEWLIRIKA
jgi:phosphoglycolate phosphatase